MARIARVIAPDYPHHVTQRGNYRDILLIRERSLLKNIDIKVLYQQVVFYH